LICIYVFVGVCQVSENLTRLLLDNRVPLTSVATLEYLGGAMNLDVEYVEGRRKYGILFICSLFCVCLRALCILTVCEYMNLEYVRIHVICRLNQAGYTIRIQMAFATGIRE